MASSLSDAANIATIVQTVWPILTFVIGVGAGVGLVSVKLLYKKEKRILANLQRPLAVIPAKQGSMDHETRLLEDVGFFSIDKLSADERSVDLITKSHRLAVLQYDPSEKGHFWGIYEQMQTRQIPVIVYAKPDEIPRSTDHLRRIQKYSLHTMCNTPLRLLSDVASIMATYPEDK